MHLLYDLLLVVTYYFIISLSERCWFNFMIFRTLSFMVLLFVLCYWQLFLIFTLAKWDRDNSQNQFNTIKQHNKLQPEKGHQDEATLEDSLKKTEHHIASLIAGLLHLCALILAKYNQSTGNLEYIFSTTVYILHTLTPINIPHTQVIVNIITTG